MGYILYSLTFLTLILATGKLTPPAPPTPLRLS